MKDRRRGSLVSGRYCLRPVVRSANGFSELSNGGGIRRRVGDSAVLYYPLFAVLTYRASPNVVAFEACS